MLTGSAAVAGPSTPDGASTPDAASTPSGSATPQAAATPAGLPDGAVPTAGGGVVVRLGHRADNSVAANIYWYFVDPNLPEGRALFLWDFGDGTVETTTDAQATYGEASLTHTYAKPGSYTVTVTAVSTANTYVVGSRSITVGNRIALASFAPDRATETFTDPEVGGPWVTSKNTRPTGFFLPKAGVAESAYLMNTWVRDVDTKVNVQFQAPASGRTMFTVAARHQVDGHYAVKATYDNLTKSTLRLTLTKTLDNVETALATVTVPKHTGFGQDVVGGDDPYGEHDATVRLQVTTENGKTVLKAKIWMAAQPEPATWNVTATDNDSRLQRNGQVGLGAYLSPVTTHGDNLTVLVNQFEATAPGGLNP